MVAPPSTQNSRTLRTTLVAWLIIVFGVVTLPISFLTALMIIAKSHGTANASFWGTLTIVGGSPFMLVIGAGILFRKQWARILLLLSLMTLLAFILTEAISPSQTEFLYIPPNGQVSGQTSESGVSLPLALIVGIVGILFVLWSPRVQAEFGGQRRKSRISAPELKNENCFQREENHKAQHGNDDSGSAGAPNCLPTSQLETRPSQPSPNPASSSVSENPSKAPGDVNTRSADILLLSNSEIFEVIIEVDAHGRAHPRYAEASMYAVTLARSILEAEQKVQLDVVAAGYTPLARPIKSKGIEANRWPDYVRNSWQHHVESMGSLEQLAYALRDKRVYYFSFHPHD